MISLAPRPGGVGCGDRFANCSLVLGSGGPRPESQVAQTVSRSCFGTRFQWRRHIKWLGSICSPQPGAGQRPALGRKLAR